MKRRKAAAAQQSFFDDMRAIEERLFADGFHEDRSMMKSERYFWHFRPSHHVATGLVTSEDVAFLRQPGRRLLSIGAFPGFLERALVEFGVPAENIVLTDKDPAVVGCTADMRCLSFDMNDAWPAMGEFDRIIFPESLCIAVGERVRGDVRARAERDAAESRRLAHVLREALGCLRSGGVVRADGPMSHPNVIRAAKDLLREAGQACEIAADRFFLVAQPSD